MMGLIKKIVGIFAGPDHGYEAQRSQKWPAFRDQWLKSHNCCSACGRSDDLEVHHIVPFHLDQTLECEESNVITLCRDDHFTFGHLKDWKSWNPTVIKDCSSYLKKVLSRP